MAKATYIHGTHGSEQERLSLLNRLTNPAFIEFLELGGQRRILEVGSGLGTLVSDVARNARASVFGIEYSQNQLARTDKSGTVHFTRGDAHSLPYNNEAFDLVYSRYVLEHLAEPVKALSEMRRVLKPGGRACAQENNIFMIALDPECPSFDFVWKQFAALQSRFGGDALIGKKLFRLFQDAGFHDIQLSYAPEIHHSGTPVFKEWVVNLIGNVDSGMNSLIEHNLATEDQINTAIAELNALIERHDASALFHWNRATGIK